MPKDILDAIKGDFTPVGIQMKPGTVSTKPREDKKTFNKHYLKYNKTGRRITYLDPRKEAEKAYQAAYKAAHKEELREKNKKYREAHKEKIREYQQEYRRTHKKPHRKQS